jgi:hypothetical protein
MSLNKADRAKINDALTYIGARCYLRVDGFIVTAILSREKMKLHISVYVNGEINGSYQWSGNESKVSEMNEISRRFWCRKTISRPACSATINLSGRRQLS